jgi:peptidoglycan/LPS O-acetylase OafA/YrhL
MGIYRLILAIFVLLSHCHVYIYGRNQGVSAVISFFLISGYVMTLTIEKNYNKKERILSFYLDRILRIFPQFLFYLILFSILTMAFGNTINLSKLLINAIIIPLNFFTVYNYEFILLPPSWSLGLELQFYIVIPLILFLKIERSIALASSMFFLIAFFCFINPDYFGYRTLPGTIFIFLSGSFIAQNRKKEMVLCVIFSICLLANPISQKYIFNGLNIEILLGIIIGTPIVYWISRYKIKSNLDTYCGNYSYGIYLSHYPAILIAGKVMNSPIEKPQHVAFVLVLSLLFAIFSNEIIEGPAQKFRIGLRKRQLSLAD